MDAAKHSRPLDAERRAWGLERPALGISLGGDAGRASIAARRRWVELAEVMGLHSVWLPEMHFERGVCPAPLLELSHWAPTTRRLRLGTTSLLLPLHPPEALAAEIAALDQLSDGRALIGLGRGFQKRMLEAFRVPPAEKRDRFDEALDRMLALWAGAAGTGAYAPRQRPHPPLAVAAFGPKGLAQAARRGLPYLASPVETLEQIAQNQRLHRAGLPDPDSPTLALAMRTVFVSDDERACAAIRERLAREMSARRIGLPRAVDTALAAPIGERVVVGGVRDVIDRLVQDRARLGLDLLIVRPQVEGVERAVLERSLGVLTETVWPAVVAAGADAPPARPMVGRVGD
ncbi:MAG: LLM class flavin-dependent oxidoreductase [Deltaproteobacteria bacterium]|nr:LLM class flavin-dependent oxidoreductase [Deltaproteobacteria bacterium]